MTAIWIAGRPGQDATDAWLDSEGVYACEFHVDGLRATLLDGWTYVPVPADLVDEIAKRGQCEGCWEAWAESLRRAYADGLID
jgi:hypothetical protein